MSCGERVPGPRSRSTRRTTKLCSRTLALTSALVLSPSVGAARPTEGSTVPARLVNSIGMEFVRVERAADPGAAVTRSFWIGRYEVTVGQFERFEMDSGYRSENRPRTRYSPTDSHPVAGVSYRDAVAFAGWLTAKEGLVYRLPKEHEWELAGGGTDGREFPWGSDPGRAGKHGNWGLGWRSLSLGWLPTLAAVGSSPSGQSPAGAEDMIGNVAEWCEWDGGEERASASPRGFPRHPLKGGCWTYPNPPKIADRSETDDNQGYQCFGFRLLLEASDAGDAP